MNDKKHNPPELGLRLLERFADTLFPELAGDLLEQFDDLVAEHGVQKARRRFWIELFSYGIRAGIHRLVHWPRQTPVFLLPSFLKSGARSMVRNKGFTLISVFSLSLGIAVWLLLMLLIRDQQQYDIFHENTDQIVRVTSQNYNRSIDLMVPLASSPGPVGPALVQALPEVKEASRITRLNVQAVVPNGRVQVQALGVTPSFFELFDFDLESGDRHQALSQPNTMVLTPSAATKIFGEIDPLGRRVHLASYGEFTVTGLLAPPRGKSHLQFEALVSLASWEATQRAQTSIGQRLDDWNQTGSFWTYLLLDKVFTDENGGAELNALSTKVNEVLKDRYPLEKRADYNFLLEPLQEIALVKHDLGNQIAPVLGSRPLYIVSIFALIILLIAVVNYVGISVARAGRRAREVGVRKVLGAEGSQLIRQFLSESILIAAGSLVLGIIFLVWLIPLFNGLGFMHATGIQLSLHGLLDFKLFVYFCGVAVGAGLLAGIIPAMHLSRFRPATVLSGSYRANRRTKLGMRKMLIVGQISMSMLFVVVATIMYRQVDHLMSADYGFESNHLVSVELDGLREFDQLRNKAGNSVAVQSIAASSDIPIATGKSISYIQSDALINPLFVYYYSTNESFADVLGLRLLAGRFFSADLPTDQQESIVINEVTAQALGFTSADDAVNQVVRVGLEQDSQQDYTIVGVLENFYFESDRNAIRRLMLLNDPTLWRYAIASPTRSSEETHLALATMWEEVLPEVEFQANTFEGLLDETLSPVKDVRYVLSIAAGLAIFLSCLGLIGFAIYTAENRRLEVGIRKVAGASSGNVIMMLVQDYGRMMLFGLVVALPLILIAYAGLMQNFPVKAGLPIISILIAILSVVLLGFLSTVVQTWHTASLDPISVIRKE